MSNISDIEEARAQRRRARAKKKMITYLIIGCCVALMFAFREYFTFDHISMVISDTTSNFKGGEYPVLLNEGVPKAVSAKGGAIEVITSTAAIGYNANGAMIQNQPHSMASPGIKTSGRYQLLFDRANKSFSLLSKTKQLYNISGSQKILDGDVNSAGLVAMATTSDRYLSQVSVYDTTQQEIFTWYTSTDYVTSVDFSGKYIVVCATRVEESGLVGVLYLLNTGKDKELFCITFDNEIPVKAQLDNGIISLFTDKGYYSYDKGGNLKGSYSFENQALQNIDSQLGSKICFTLGSGGALNRVVVVTKSGDVVTEIDPQEAVLGVHYYGGKTAVLTADKLSIYDKNGQEVDSTRYAKTCLRLYASKKNLFVQASDSIIKQTM